MAIYPDKKDGKLTGRFRVELQSGKQRYRKRWDTLQEAKQDEEAVKAAWARGDAVGTSERLPGGPEVHTFATVIPLAKGMLWDGLSTEASCWAHVRDISEILGVNTKLDAVDTHSVDRVIQALRKRGKADGTINRYLSHLRKFLMWSKSRGYRTLAVAGDDGLTIDWRKESPGRIRWITPEEEAGIRDYLLGLGTQVASDIWDVIDVAIETGCRRDEILTAQLDQVNGNRLHIWVTKADLPRTVPMSPRIVEKLTSLLKRKAMPDRGSLRNYWIRAQKHLGLQEDADFVFHTCRHTCATRLVDAGINVLVIKEWLGHKRIETTLRYAHVRPQNLDDALVRVGEYVAAANENCRISAVPTLPHTYPTGGGMAPHRAAA
jgi:integrase